MARHSRYATTYRTLSKHSQTVLQERRIPGGRHSSSSRSWGRADIVWSQPARAMVQTIANTRLCSWRAPRPPPQPPVIASVARRNPVWRSSLSLSTSPPCQPRLQACCMPIELVEPVFQTAVSGLVFCMLKTHVPRPARRLTLISVSGPTSTGGGMIQDDDVVARALSDGLMEHCGVSKTPKVHVNTGLQVNPLAVRFLPDPGAVEPDPQAFVVVRGQKPGVYRDRLSV